MSDYKATPEEWQKIENSQVFNATFQKCVLELRSRIETLEENFESFFESTNFCTNVLIDRVEKLETGAGIRDIVAEGVKDTYNPTSNSDQIRSLLVQRVSLAICYAQQRDETGSRAAIKEVSKWLMEHAGGVRAAWMLVRELER
mgnify:CR=1 FL=1